MWVELRAVALSVGDLTPAGPVVGIVYLGELGLIELDVEGRAEPYRRGFEDPVQVHRPTSEKMARK